MSRTRPVWVMMCRRNVPSSLAPSRAIAEQTREKAAAPVVPQDPASSLDFDEQGLAATALDRLRRAVGAPVPGIELRCARVAGQGGVI